MHKPLVEVSAGAALDTSSACLVSSSFRFPSTSAQLSSCFNASICRHAGTQVPVFKQTTRNKIVGEESLQPAQDVHTPELT